MSGGALDYAQYKLDEIARQILQRASTPLERALAAHIDKVGKAVHALEWVWSGDTSPGSEEAAIRAVVSPADVLAVTIASAETALADLTAALEQAR